MWITDGEGCCAGGITAAPTAFISCFISGFRVVTCITEATFGAGMANVYVFIELAGTAGWAGIADTLWNASFSLGAYENTPCSEATLIIFFTAIAESQLWDACTGGKVTGLPVGTSVLDTGLFAGVAARNAAQSCSLYVETFVPGWTIVACLACGNAIGVSAQCGTKRPVTIRVVGTWGA